MSIWAHTIVQNEDRYLWYAVASVIDYVDKILIWDTGSTDNTPELISEIKKRWPDKVLTKEVGNVTPDKFTNMRQQMLRMTKSDWFFILDGDEVWWDREISKLTDVIRKEGNKYDSIVSEYINPVGDIYHFQDKSAGKYKIKKLEGFVTIRAMNLNKIKGLKIDKPHGQQGIYDGEGHLIQDRNEKDMYFMEKPSYLHFTNLPRSGQRENDLKVPKRGFKFKFELGIEFPRDYYYPDVFFRPHPDIVRPVWERRTEKYLLLSTVETPLKKLKRRLVNVKSGY